MRLLKKLLQSRTLYGTIIVVILWEMFHVAIKSKVIPAPVDTVKMFFKLLGEGLLFHVAVSTLRIIVALIIALIIGVPVGLWMGSNKRVDSILAPVAYILYPIPKIAFLPVFMILLGLGESPKVILIITIIIFQILLAARDGVKEIPMHLIYSVKSLGLSKWQMYTNLIVPAVLPKIISALRVSIGISISVLFFAENFATNYGIGYFIMNTWTMIRYVDMFAGILALSLMGLAIFKTIDAVEKKLCPWLFIKD